MNHIFISPHLDDVVWSCGGRISKLKKSNEKIIVITIFQNPSQSERHKENKLSLNFLGVDHVELNFQDAAIRKEQGKALYQNADKLFSAIHQDDSELYKKILGEIKFFLGKNDTLHAPLALGNHIDHVIVAKACEKIHNYNTYWYEDFPYCIWNSATYYASKNLTPIWCDVDFETWEKSSLFYHSQIIALFGKLTLFKTMLRRYSKQRGKESGLEYAERIWIPKI